MIKLDELWKKRRVHILSIEEATKDFKDFVKNELDRILGRQYCDFFILHQGLISNINNFEEGFDLLEQKVRFVILDTGGGKSKLAENKKLRWLEFSNLADYLIHRPGDKYGLVRLLSALRWSYKYDSQ